MVHSALNFLVLLMTDVMFLPQTALVLLNWCQLLLSQQLMILKHNIHVVSHTNNVLYMIETVCHHLWVQRYTWQYIWYWTKTKWPHKQVPHVVVESGADSTHTRSITSGTIHHPGATHCWFVIPEATSTYLYRLWAACHWRSVEAQTRSCHVFQPALAVSLTCTRSILVK